MCCYIDIILCLTSEQICGCHAELIGARIGNGICLLQAIAHGVKDSVLVVVHTPYVGIPTADGIVHSQGQDLVHTDDLITVRNSHNRNGKRQGDGAQGNTTSTFTLQVGISKEAR